MQGSRGWWPLLIAATGTLLPTAVSAHTFGQSYTLPIPLSLYGSAAALALLLSFIIAAVFLRVGTARTENHYQWSADGPISNAVFFLCGVIALALLALTIVAGRIGHPNSNMNISMPLFWIVFVLAYAYFSAFVMGGTFQRIHPLRLLFSLLALIAPRLSEGAFKYPAKRLGYWPAVLGYFAFIWLELFALIKPFSLANALLVYCGLLLVGSLLFGVKHWLRYGDPFSVLLRLLSYCAPLRLERRRSLTGDDGSDSKGRTRWVWRLQWPFAATVRNKPEHGSLLFFVVAMLATTAYDGLHETQPWVKFYWSTLIPALDPEAGLRALYIYQPWFARWQWFGLLLVALGYFTAYWMAVSIGKRLSHARQSTAQLMRHFAYSLLPIALVYHAAHYYTLLQTEGIRLLERCSDPFGWGWNLFGGREAFRYSIIPNTETVWHVQLGLIVLGHVASVVVAHRQALLLFDDRRQASLSQLPMLLLMIGYTVVGLWILALPIQTARFL